MDIANIPVRANELHESESYHELVKLYSKGIEAEPGNADFWAERGVAKLNLRMPKEALKDFEIAIDLDPFNPYRYASRAYAKDKYGDVSGAIEDYKKAIILDPEDAIAHNNLGILEEKIGRIGSSKINFQNADKLAKELGLDVGHVTNSAINSATIVSEKELLSDSTEKSLLYFMRKVFTSKKMFVEFGEFITSGFRISNKNN